MRGTRSAHPRVCGENHQQVIGSFHSPGSSPRVRGKHAEAVGGVGDGGLIPACAGKTGASRRCGSRPRAHPRVCGENSPHGCGPLIRRGSSPRVRGKRRLRGRRARRRGLIPACAGKTPLESQRFGNPGAHPRVCGENKCDQSHIHILRGSSPRVRGKPLHILGDEQPDGLIPACAGKTSCVDVLITLNWAHPRVCGENQFSGRWRATSWGSSPRVRGKRFLTWAFTAQAGRILETLGPYASSGSYSFPGVRANGGRCRAHRRGPCTGPALGRPLGAS